MKNVFELEQPTKVKVLDVFVLTSKDRKPGDPHRRRGTAACTAAGG